MKNAIASHLLTHTHHMKQYATDEPLEGPGYFSLHLLLLVPAEAQRCITSCTPSLYIHTSTPSLPTPS